MLEEVVFEWSYGGTSVFIAGSFNNWCPTKMQKTTDGTFQVTLTLEPGIHEYKFIVDQNWCYDINKPHTSNPVAGAINNVLEVKNDGNAYQKKIMELEGTIAMLKNEILRLEESEKRSSSLQNVINQHLATITSLRNEIKQLKEEIDVFKKDPLQEKYTKLAESFRKLTETANNHKSRMEVAEQYNGVLEHQLRQLRENEIQLKAAAQDKVLAEKKLKKVELELEQLKQQTKTDEGGESISSEDFDTLKKENEAQQQRISIKSDFHGVFFSIIIPDIQN